MSFKPITKYTLLLLLVALLTMAWLVSAAPAYAEQSWISSRDGQAYSIKDSLFNCEVFSNGGNESGSVSQIILRRENELSSLKITIADSSEYIDDNTDTLNLLDDQTSHRLYRKAPAELEWEIILWQCPDSNSLSFPIITEGLRFYYQDLDTLVKYRAELDYTDDVPGSYAVYVAAGDGYRSTGKLFHIYRPRAWDSGGDSVWCDLRIDTTSQLLTIDIPGTFVATADYPITIDPTIGYTSQGSLGKHIGASDYRHLANYGDYQSGTGTMETAYICAYRTNSSAACTATVAVYTYDPILANCEKVATSAKVAITKFATDPADAEWFAAPISGELADGKEHIVSFQGFESCDYCLRVCADYIGIWGYERYYDYAGWGTNNNLSGYSSNSYCYSVYVEYKSDTISDNPFIRCRKLKRSAQ